MLDSSKNEYTVLSLSSNSNNEKMMIIRSNTGLPIYANTALREKFTSNEFKTLTAISSNSVESRFPVAATKVIADFSNSAASSADFSVGHILKTID